MMIEAWLDRLSGSAAGWAITPLAGLTNRSFLLERGTERLVLRLPGAGTARYIDRAVELHNHLIAAQLGLAPEILLADPECLVTRYLDGAEPLQPADFTAPATIEAVGRLLGRLHRSGRHFRGRMELFPKIDQYLTLAGPAADNALKDLRALAEPARLALETSPAAWVPSHIDPSPANFLRRGDELFLIDWEYSAMCEPAWDLAGVAIEARLDATQRRRLLSAYGAGDDASTRARVELFGALLHLVAASWAAAQIPAAEDADSYWELARDYTERARPLIEGAEFAELVLAIA
jgi:thiamine kinase-like enzyme